MRHPINTYKSRDFITWVLGIIPIASGDFASDSEVIRDALRFKQEQMKDIEFLRETARAARESGISSKTRDTLLTDIKNKLRSEGAL